MTTASLPVAFLDDHLDQGGTTTFLVKLLPALQPCGIASAVIASDARGNRAPAFDRAGIARFTYPYGTSQWLYDDRLRGAYRLLARYQPHAVVASHETVSFDLLRYIPAGVRRLAVIHVDNPWSYHLVEFHARHLDGVVCPTPAIAEKTRAMLGPAGPPVVTIPYGVSIPEPTAPAVVTGTEALRLLYVGRLEDAQKRVRRFVPLWQELRRLERPVHWTIIGDGPEADYLRAHLPSDERHTVEVRLNVEYEEIGRFYARHHVILLLSDYEGLPLSLLEGMSHGLVPVVTAQRSGIPELVDATCGVIVPPDAPAETAAALDRLRPGTASFEAMRAAARRRICETHNVESMAANWARVLRDGAPAGAARWPKTIRFQGPPERTTHLPAWYFSGPLRPLRRWLHRAVQAGRG